MLQIPNYSVNFCANQPPRKFKRLMEHSGPTLKLTEKDNAEIVKLRDKLTEKIAEHYKLSGFYAAKVKKRNPYLEDRILGLQSEIENLNEDIRNIKIARFEQQKKEAAMLNVL